MSDKLYIWISRWQDFQHYRPERDRAPAWLKTYTKQLDDHRYLELTWPQRAILHDLRSAFARAHGRLPSDTRALTHRLGGRVTSAQLEALNHAGFIELISRPTLEQRLEQLYSSPRARIEGEEEVEKEKEPSILPTPTSNGAHQPQGEPATPEGTEGEVSTDIDFDSIFKDVPA